MAERGGTHLCFHSRATDVYGAPYGGVDDASDLPLKAPIYADEKPEHQSFANETRNLTAAEFGAKFR